MCSVTITIFFNFVSFCIWQQTVRSAGVCDGTGSRSPARYWAIPPPGIEPFPARYWVIPRSVLSNSPTRYWTIADPCFSPPGGRRGRPLARCAICKHVCELPTHSYTRRLLAVQAEDVAGIGGRLDLHQCVRSPDLTSKLNSTLLMCMPHAVGGNEPSLWAMVMHINSHGETCVMYYAKEISKKSHKTLCNFSAA